MRVGLITYHSAYNFGSVLQAYATQEKIKSLGNTVDIINYRMDSQKNFYSLSPQHLGFKTNLKYFLARSTKEARFRRAEKYEDTFKKIFGLTEEFNDPKDDCIFKDAYDVFVSGSDQIWNKESQELKDVDWRHFMSPYLLEFTKKKKVSYASSIAKMTDEDLELIKKALQDFDSISMREPSSAKRMENLLGRNVAQVLDPTFLLSYDEWLKLIDKWQNDYVQEDYIFYYSLKGVRGLNYDLNRLEKIARKLNLRLVTIAPLSVPLGHPHLINAADACIFDFLGLIRDAKIIITNSYHGTLFSVNFNKNFYSLQGYPGSNMRVEEVSRLLGFEDRVVYDFDSMNFKSKPNYNVINKKRTSNIRISIDYLKKSISS